MAVRKSDASVALDQIERAEWTAIRAAEQPQLPRDTPSAEWRAKAACGKADPDLFLPYGPDDPQVALAISICRTRCPALMQCRELRYQTRAAGTWGGVYYPEVGLALKQCKHDGCEKGAQNSRNPYCGFEHEHDGKVGTRAGYALHVKKRKEPACDECSAGEAEAKRKYRDPRAKGNPPRPDLVHH